LIFGTSQCLIFWKTISSYAKLGILHEVFIQMFIVCRVTLPKVFLKNYPINFASKDHLHIYHSMSFKGDV
jgi:hypothetical protein